MASLLRTISPCVVDCEAVYDTIASLTLFPSVLSLVPSSVVTLASLMALHYARDAPTSGPLHSLFFSACTKFPLDNFMTVCFLVFISWLEYSSWVQSCSPKL
jgi:hypothetical protein